MKLEITGSAILCSDLHFGKNDNSPSKRAICEDVVDKICKYAKDNGIGNIFMLGDWFDNRRSIGVDTIDSALRSVRKMASVASVYMVVGNHDSFDAHKIDVNSLNGYDDIDNVTVIRTPTDFSFNGRKCLFAPWLTDPKTFKKTEYDAIFGHLDIPVCFLNESYVRENLNRSEISKTDAVLIDDDDLLNDGHDEIQPGGFEYAMTMLDVTKHKGVIYTGHIHNHSETVVGDRTVVFVGSQWQQNFGEKDSIDGFYVVDADMKRTFHRTHCPDMKEIYVSDIMKEGIGSFDFTVAKNNVVKVVFDVVVESESDVADIMKRVEDTSPYEMLPSDFKAKAETDSNDCSYLLDDLRLGNFHYIEKYIDGIPDDDLVKENVTRQEVMDALREAYEETAIEE